MSLINDALKRAQKAQSGRRPPQAIVRPLQPVVESRAGSKSFAACASIIGFGLLSLSVWLLPSWQRHPADPARPASLRNSRTHNPHAFLAAPMKSATAQPPATRGDLPSKEPALTAKPAADPKSAPASVQPAFAQINAQPPGAASTGQNPGISSSALPARLTPSPNMPLTLEAIFYRLKKPSVRINHQTLYLGDKIGPAKIISIERFSVQALVDGKTNTLKL